MSYSPDLIGYRSTAAPSYPTPGDPCQPLPVNATDPLFRSGQVERGPNDFKLGIQGPDPLLAVGGTHDQQEFQRDTTLALAALAFPSYVSGHVGVSRVPSDAQVRGILDRLNPNPPLGTDGVEVTRAVYQSSIPNATPQQAYQHFVNNPGEVFGAGGMEIRPPAGQLVDGGRYMLEMGGPAPTWLPVEIRLDPAKHSVTILTLDGHVLRGEQTFTFTADCNGGVVLTQDARFQASSRLPGEVQQLTSIAQGQHQAWQFAHREMYEQFNGDAGYSGMGTDAFNQQQLSAWSELLYNVVVHPGRSADAAIDTGGELTNAGVDLSGRFADWGIDNGGEIIGDTLDRLGIPGGAAVRRGFDLVGDATRIVTDRAGDYVSTVADRGGDVARVVIDVVTPW
jgi:hypothetical protein